MKLEARESKSGGPRARESAIPVRGENDSLADGLGSCRSLEEFHDLCAPLGLYASGRRFLHLELDIGNRCNLRCIMCYHSLESVRRVKAAYLSPEAFSLVAADALPHAYRFTPSLGNEPLASPHFSSILRIAGGYEVPHVNFNTNGLLLDDEKIDAIVENGVTQVCVSVDGATPSTYNAIRRGGDFHRLVRNVQRLVERRNAAGRALPRVRFDMVMMRRNVREMVDVARLAARLGVQDLNFSHLVCFEGLGMEEESLRLDKELSDLWLERALAEAEKLGLVVQFHPAPFHAGGGKEETATTDAAPYLPRPYCPYPFFHVSMGPGGHVLPCPFSHGEPPCGQVSAETPLEGIWLGEELAVLRRRILSRDPPRMCRRCSFLSNRYPNVAELFATRKN